MKTPNQKIYNLFFVIKYMIKGLILSLAFAIFIVSSIFLVSNLTGDLQVNVITGNVIGISNFVNYNFIAFIISLVIFVLVIFWFRSY